MGRRKETKAEKTETKAGAPKTAPLLDPNRFLHHMNTFKGYLAKRETVQGHYRNARKVCKAEGIDPARIDDAIRMERGDPEDFRREYEDIAQVLKITGAPFQLEIYDTRYGNPVEQAKAEGRAAGRSGSTMDCRWPEGSDAEAAYTEAYTAAQADLAAGAFNGGAEIEDIKTVGEAAEVWNQQAERVTAEGAPH